MGERLRGRAGQAALKRRRAQHPTCAHCAARGIVKATSQIDHILALALGGEDVDENCQGLCDLCHAIKTAMEGASTGGAANHPDWLTPSTARLTIVSGPPCSGKSTEVDRLSASSRHGLLIDLDDIGERLRPGFNRRWDADLLNQAIRVRNALLGSLGRMHPRSLAWFIVSCPTTAELQWWLAKLEPARSIRLDPGKSVCLQRAARRGPGETAKVEAWYERARQPWHVERMKPKRVAFDADGYPVEGTNDDD